MTLNRALIANTHTVSRPLDQTLRRESLITDFFLTRLEIVLYCNYTDHMFVHLAIPYRAAAADVVDAEMGGVLLDLYRIMDQIDALERELLSATSVMVFWAAEGATSLGAWVEARTGRPREQVRECARLGHAVASLPVVAAAGLPPRKVRLIVDCRPVTAEDEELLVCLARELPLRDFAAATTEWRARRDADGTEPSPEPVQSEVSIAQHADGYWAINGTLAPDDGALVNAVLDAGAQRAMRAREAGDPTETGYLPRQWRATALVDASAQLMRQDPNEASVPDRYRVALTLLSGDDHVALCDCLAYRVVLNAKREILDIGRASRTWTMGIRRAVVARDQGCRFPGCDRPVSWCDIHHCQPWEEDGHTSVENGVLLCRKHHTFLHAKGWTVAIHHHQPIFRRPDGTVFEIHQIHQLLDTG